MSRSPALLAALAAVGIVPCGDNSCVFGSPGGMAMAAVCAEDHDTGDEDPMPAVRT